MSSLLTQFSLFLFLFLLGNNGKQADVLQDNPHPYYVSVTELQHNAAEESLEISIKFFTDDFEKTLEKANHAKLDITASKDRELLDKYIPAYVNTRFRLVADEKALQLQYLGYEIEKESVYCYFEVGGLSSIDKINVSNSLLYDLTKEQLNIMHFTVKGKRISRKLSYPASQAVFVF